MNTYNLQRFLDAQDRYDSYQSALKELRQGRKRSHWIWFIFPQQKGLGRSYNSEYYGLDGAEEAAAYLAHPVLGTRLRECCAALLQHAQQKTMGEIMGSGIDVLKLRTSMRLFNSIAPHDVFAQILQEMFGEQPPINEKSHPSRTANLNC